MGEIAGLPYWEVAFDDNGRPNAGDADTLISGAPGLGVTDLMVFAHGWNNDRGQATSLYRRFFEQVPGLLTGGGPGLGFAGVIWPAKRWADETIPGSAGGAAAPAGEGGAAGIGSPFSRLWDGAKEALRQLTYFEMKKRAGVVGQAGLGPLVGRLAAAAPELRVHLIGHSFGARLVSFTLAGLPDPGAGASPVKSLLLLQGAFSHFAFADALPDDRRRGGALKGMARRVDGPLAASFSVHDLAVGKIYPLASLSSRDDSAAASDLLFRWGAMGHDGAQACAASELPLGPVGQPYQLAHGSFTNLNGDAVISQGGPPSGAHSDIFHPEVVWAAISVAGLAKAP